MNREDHTTLMNSMYCKSREEINEMFDSGMFNQIVKGYVALLLADYNFDENEKMDEALYRLDKLFDEVSAKEARDYYKKV